MSVSLRVALRYLEATALLSPEYVDGLLKTNGLSVNATKILQSLGRSLRDGARDPFPVSELAAFLESRGVFEEDIAKVLAAKPRVPRKPKALGFHDAFLELEKVSGKAVAYQGSLELHDGAAASMLAWAKALKKLKPKAKTLFKDAVRKILVSVPNGTEDASWRGGTIVLTVRDHVSSPDVLATYITHELGHAAEEKFHVDLFAPPWGQPPFISGYAEMRPNVEDFAESYANYILSPGDLKRVAPEKFAEMKRLIR